MKIYNVQHDKTTRTYHLTVVLTEQEYKDYGSPQGIDFETGTMTVPPPRTAMEEAGKYASKEHEEFYYYWSKRKAEREALDRLHEIDKGLLSPKTRYEKRVKELGEVPWMDDVVMFVPPEKEPK